MSREPQKIDNDIKLPRHVRPDDPRLKLSETAVDLARDRQAVLHTHFGLKKFRPGQAEAIDSLQQGRNVLAILPTGSGKTLIYELTTYLINRPCLIVSPLLSLMQDQVGRLNQRGERRAVALNSLLTKPEKDSILSRLQQYRFIFISPEMLQNEGVMTAVRHCNIGLLVIDEAHCISTWGPDFRPAYLSLGDVRSQLDNPLTCALTATADAHVQADILTQLHLRSSAERNSSMNTVTDDQQNVQVIRQSVNRPNIFLVMRSVTSRKEKATELMGLMAEIVKPGIIYFSSKAQADEWAQRLNDAGYPAASYHAGLDAQTRYTVQQQFMADQLQIVCATSAFGMGIDKDNIRFVIHYHLPSNLNDYVQEIGRAGRDGQQSIAICLIAPGDEQLPADLATLPLPNDRQVKTFYETKRPTLQTDMDQLLDYYKKHHFSEQQLIDRFSALRQERQLALCKFINFTRSPDCLRKKLLTDFNESSVPHDHNCCAPIGTEFSLSKLGLAQDQHELQTTMKIPGWRQQFEALFSENFTNSNV
ncbi:RecQ family ATP-dependent DNA helicase [Furfurilactobacillus rossiae]|uniref:ATP-dependent helicase RecQ n=1 Tax=Furfurilactobacillus rossiae DSM 15814 TaxID=1114972 RepID=A0A0R1RK98_9LACO|nr:RecQ family ATP-dependent DNA helicase [Furfurilactobacillus rossiae]KRL57174.1 ATP-dependent helicase RecQ [Furfurilactobacillus rossiae DSM 15814]QFR65941.1 RecQ family ATP-dependent DNA helicase [Furfurilactobacillus rossiae]QLE61357.1 ATP-dependent DNA helicase RecQ [Furfurilactobacillus rossiae]